MPCTFGPTRPYRSSRACRQRSSWSGTTIPESVMTPAALSTAETQSSTAPPSSGSRSLARHSMTRGSTLDRRHRNGPPPMRRSCALSSSSLAPARNPRNCSAVVSGCARATVAGPATSSNKRLASASTRPGMSMRQHDLDQMGRSGITVWIIGWFGWNWRHLGPRRLAAGV